MHEQLSGVLVVDKPIGCTSHDVVARVRRALGETRIGHTGTLDPMATGVLPLVVGRATRLASMLSGAAKQYEASIRLGCATDTYDATGVVADDPAGRIAEDIDIAVPAGVDVAAVEAALDAFRGEYDQFPPAYSAKKINGVASYRLARRNEAVAPAAVRVTVSELVLLGCDGGVVRVKVTATAGFYVRSLAHELGAALGCGGHLSALRRTRAGVFSLEEAVPLDRVETEGRAAADRLIPMGRLLPEIPAAILTARGAQRAAHGSALSPADLADPPVLAAADNGARLRLIDPEGGLIGIAEVRPSGLLHPSIVLV